MPKIQLPEKFSRVLTTKSRFIVLIGGRSSGKSEGVARLLILRSQTERADILCGREYQNSIDDSVHKLLRTLITNKLKVSGFDITDKKINCKTGGGFRFKGFARNPENVKSAQDFKYSWIEEAQSLSERSIEDLLPTIRAEGSKLFFTANPQASADPFSQRFIVPYKAALDAQGYYEDDLHLIIKLNWRDNPWHGELEKQRLWDYRNKPRAVYDHIWEGEFNDSIAAAIILPEWFDAAIDAHKKLGFKPVGRKIVSHDPSDEGVDDKAVCLRHGSVILDIKTLDTGDAGDGMEWALDYTLSNQADMFIWDCDGLGVSLKRQVAKSLDAKKCDYVMFKGSESPADFDLIYDQLDNDNINTQKTNGQTFKNKRAQHYWLLRDRFYKTYRAVEHGEYCDPDELISVSSEMSNIAGFRSEICRIPKKPNGNGLIQIMTKKEMKSMQIMSPNQADAAMMSMYIPQSLQFISSSYSAPDITSVPPPAPSTVWV